MVLHFIYYPYSLQQYRERPTAISRCLLKSASHGKPHSSDCLFTLLPFNHPSFEPFLIIITYLSTGTVNYSDLIYFSFIINFIFFFVSFTLRYSIDVVTNGKLCTKIIQIYFFFHGYSRWRSRTYLFNNFSLISFCMSINDAILLISFSRDHILFLLF